MPDMNTSTTERITFSPALAIPDHLVGEVQSKLAYVDEDIAGAPIGLRAATRLH